MLDHVLEGIVLHQKHIVLAGKMEKTRDNAPAFQSSHYVTKRRELILIANELQSKKKN